MPDFNFIDHCVPCGAWCCHGEQPYASPPELVQLGVSRIGQQEGGACTFLGKDNLCTVYQQRPLECRIFPYDLKSFENQLTWVVWQNCPAQSHMKHDLFLEEFESKLPSKYSLEYLMDYVEYHRDHEPEKYGSIQFKVLRPVIWKPEILVPGSTV